MQECRGRVPRCSLRCYPSRSRSRLTLAGHPLLQPEGELDAGEYWRLGSASPVATCCCGDAVLRVAAVHLLAGAGPDDYAAASRACSCCRRRSARLACGWRRDRGAAWMRARTDVRAAGRRSSPASPSALTGIVALQEALILQSAIDPLLMAAFALTATRALAGADAAAMGGEWWRAGAAGDQSSQRVAARAAVCRRDCVPAVDGRSAPAACAAPRSTPAMWLLGARARARAVRGPHGDRHRRMAGAAGARRTELYIGNHPGANGTYTVVDGDPAVDRGPARGHAPGGGAGRRPCAVGRRGVVALRPAVARVVATRARRAARLFAYKVWLTTHAWELPVNVSYAWFREQVLLLRLLPVGAWLLVPLGLAAAVAGIWSCRPATRAAWRWFRWLLPAYLASVAIFFVVDRYRAPALVLGAIFVGVLASMRRAIATQSGHMQRRRLSAASPSRAWHSGRRPRSAAVPAGRGGRRHAHGPARHRRWPRRRGARVAGACCRASSGAWRRLVPRRARLAGTQPARRCRASACARPIDSTPEVGDVAFALGGRAHHRRQGRRGRAAAGAGGTRRRAARSRAARSRRWRAGRPASRHGRARDARGRRAARGTAVAARTRPGVGRGGPRGSREWLLAEHRRYVPRRCRSHREAGVDDGAPWRHDRRGGAVRGGRTTRSLPRDGAIQPRDRARAARAGATRRSRCCAKPCASIRRTRRPRARCGNCWRTAPSRVTRGTGLMSKP